MKSPNLVLGVMAAVGLGCDEPCRLDSECDLGSVCADGRCRERCDDARDCPPELDCVQRRCVQPRDAGARDAGADVGPTDDLDGSLDAGSPAPECTGDETRCSGSTLQQCTAGRFRDVERCVYDCADGACLEKSCPRNATRCFADRIQTCGSFGLWRDTMQCPHRCLEGECVGCAAGEVRCDGTVAERCDVGGAWQVAANCPFGCLMGECSGTCVPGDRRCSEGRSELCDASGQWSAGSECASPRETCDDTVGACVTTLVDAGGYGIDGTEVTARQYRQFLESAAHRAVDQHALCADNTALSVYRNGDCESYAFDPEGAPDLPVVCIDWCDAHAYCRWAGKRLCGAVGGGPVPQDVSSLRVSQWYLACSADGSNGYPYGREYEPGRCNDDSTGLVPVGSTPGCEGGVAGLHDMAGNAVEFEDEQRFSSPGSYSFRLRGGDYTSGDRARCDSHVRTTTGGRSWAQPGTGFRCCSP
jgi:hypothetical protein